MRVHHFAYSACHACHCMHGPWVCRVAQLCTILAAISEAWMTPGSSTLCRPLRIVDSNTVTAPAEPRHSTMEAMSWSASLSNSLWMGCMLRMRRCHLSNAVASAKRRGRWRLESAHAQHIYMLYTPYMVHIYMVYIIPLYVMIDNYIQTFWVLQRIDGSQNIWALHNTIENSSNLYTATYHAHDCRTPNHV